MAAATTTAATRRSVRAGLPACCQDMLSYLRVEVVVVVVVLGGIALRPKVKGLRGPFGVPWGVPRGVPTGVPPGVPLGGAWGGPCCELHSGPANADS